MYFKTVLNLSVSQFLFMPHEAVSVKEDSHAGEILDDEAQLRDPLRAYALLARIEAQGSDGTIAATPDVLLWSHPWQNPTADRER
jgi:hypothetical protein